MAGIELIEAVPVLGVADLARSLAFYRDQLGFVVAFEASPLPYAGLQREGMVLHLDGGEHEFCARPTSARFHIRGVDLLYEEMMPRGVVKPDESLATMPHGMRQFSVLDPDRNRITFAESVTVA